LYATGEGDPAAPGGTDSTGHGASSFWQEDRAERTMAALQRLLPHRVRARRDRSVVGHRADAGDERISVQE
jgi:hypothetical protein